LPCMWRMEGQLTLGLEKLVDLSRRESSDKLLSEGVLYVNVCPEEIAGQMNGIVECSHGKESG
jgi:hypothetical protein